MHGFWHWNVLFESWLCHLQLQMTLYVTFHSSVLISKMGIGRVFFLVWVLWKFNKMVYVKCMYRAWCIWKKPQMILVNMVVSRSSRQREKVMLRIPKYIFISIVTWKKHWFCTFFFSYHWNEEIPSLDIS